MTTSLGDISLAEYQRITRARTSWSARLLRGAAIVLGCGSLVAAGDFIGPWTGKHARVKSMEEALQILSDNSAEVTKAEIGLGAVNRHVERAIGEIGAIAREDTSVGRYASLYLRNIAKLCVASLISLEREGVRPEEQSRLIRTIRDATAGR